MDTLPQAQHGSAAHDLPRGGAAPKIANECTPDPKGCTVSATHHGAFVTCFITEDCMRALLFTCGLIVALSLPAYTQKAPAAKSAPAAVPAAPINLNTATQAQLESLPGVGAKAAQRILEYRQKNGSFKKIEDLMNVKGIGEKSFLRLKPLITVAGEKADRAGGTTL
jgi:competence protein ComEA